jgi:hypothetical protein
VRDLKKPDSSNDREMRNLEYKDAGLSKLLCGKEKSERSNEDQRDEALSDISLLAIFLE